MNWTHCGQLLPMTTGIERANEVCESLERSRAALIAEVQYWLAAKCESDVIVEKLREAVTKYDAVRDRISPKPKDHDKEVVDE